MTCNMYVTYCLLHEPLCMVVNCNRPLVYAARRTMKAEDLVQLDKNLNVKETHAIYRLCTLPYSSLSMLSSWRRKKTKLV